MNTKLRTLWVMRVNRERFLNFYVMVVFALMLTIWLTHWQWITGVRFVKIAIIAGLSVVFDLKAISLPTNKDLTLSMKTSVLVATMVIFGTLDTFTLLLLVLPVHMAYFWKRNRLTVLFNVSQDGLAAYVAFVAYQLAGGELGGVDLRDPIAILVFALTYFVMNNAFVILYMWVKGDLSGKFRISDIYHQEFFAFYFIELVFGIVIALLYPRIGFLGLCASVLVVWVTAFNYSRLYKALAQASKDELTDLFNRRHLRKVLQKLHKRTPISLLLLDLDGFKVYNDTFGHPQGDRLLQQLSNLLVEIVTSKGTVFRYGGEEFAVLLPKTTSNEAVEVAESIRARVADYPFAISGGSTSSSYRVTVSIGVATCPQKPNNLEQIVQLADKCLYKAKSMNKNRVVALPADCQQAEGWA